MKKWYLYRYRNKPGIKEPSMDVNKRSSDKAAQEMILRMSKALSETAPSPLFKKIILISTS